MTLATRQKRLNLPLGDRAPDEINVVVEIQHFFETYKMLEGKHTSTAGWDDAATARRIIVESAQRFEGKPE